jgi:hypothetical protein
LVITTFVGRPGRRRLRAQPQGLRAGRRTTWIALTSAGRKALRQHVAALRQLTDVVD